MEYCKIRSVLEQHVISFDLESGDGGFAEVGSLCSDRVAEKRTTSLSFESVRYLRGLADHLTCFRMI